MSNRQLKSIIRRSQSSAEVRSEGQAGSIIYREDNRVGRSVTGQYQQNLYTSKDGHVKFDAHAGASRNIDRNQNDVQAGIKGSIEWWREWSQLAKDD